MERDYRGWNALDRAAYRGDLAEIARLLKNGADPNDGDLGGYTPLYRALKGGQDEAALCLLEAVDRAPARRMANPLSHAVAGLLPNDPVSPDKLLALAAEKGLIGFVSRMLELKRTSPRGLEIALLRALPQPEVVTLLLQQSGLKSLDDALDVALTQDHHQSAELLLAKGARPSERSLEHCLYHQHPQLEALRARFPGPVAEAEARVNCKHDDIRPWDYGHYCNSCGARW
jgi:hypothetical protein